MRRELIGLLLMLILALATGCNRELGRAEKAIAASEVDAGRDAIIRYGCGACHVIPGIPDAHAYVGPPLEAYERRHYIAGNLPNTEDNLIRWIQDPQAIEPGTAMPNLNVSADEARSIAAYLYSR